MPTDLPNERTLRKPGTLELDPAAGEGVAIDETPRLIASNRVEGTAVYDRSGRHLGAIHNFMVDKISGQVAYAVLAFGGFLGLGETHHPLPWKALSYSTELGGYVVDLEAGVLAEAPSQAAG
ncbi:PRC-barrel domain-containing protein [Methylobacterium sp. D53M]